MRPTVWMLGVVLLYWVGTANSLAQPSGQMPLRKFPPLNEPVRAVPVPASYAPIHENVAPSAIPVTWNAETEWSQPEPSPENIGFDADCSEGFVRPFQVYGGGEVIVMKPRFEDGLEEDSARRVLDFHMRAGSRFWLGFQNANDAGLRMTYSQYDNLTPAILRPQHAALHGTHSAMGLNLYTIDLEIEKHFDCHSWMITARAGARYTEFEQRVVSEGPFDVRGKWSHTIGPTLSVDFDHPCRFGAFHWIARTRGSLLVGEAKYWDLNDSQNTDDIGSTFELQIGMSWRRCFGRLGEVYLHGVYEHQTRFGAGTFFDGASFVGPDSFVGRKQDYDIALMGFGFAVGLTR